MRSEKDPMPACREKSVVEIQFRDIQRDQEGHLGLSKQKEEKKEIFTKVSAYNNGALLTWCALLQPCRRLRSAPRTAPAGLSSCFYTNLSFFSQVNACIIAYIYCIVLFFATVAISSAFNCNEQHHVLV